MSQGIEFLIEVLNSNKNRTDCFVLIVGGGNRYDLLQNWITENRPANVKLMKHLERREYDILESCCDVGMIFLDSRFTIPNFPSRILSYMECKLPLLIASDKVSDLGPIAKNNEFGVWSISNDVNQFNKNLDFYINNSEDRKRMGNNAYDFLTKNYDVFRSYDTIMKHFK